MADEMTAMVFIITFVSLAIILFLFLVVSVLKDPSKVALQDDLPDDPLDDDVSEQAVKNKIIDLIYHAVGVGIKLNLLQSEAFKDLEEASSKYPKNNDS